MRPFIIYAVLLLSLSSCNSVDKHKIENLNNGKIDVIGHAGSGFLYPILPFNPLPTNSRASIEKALFSHGADGVEVDVQMSRDSVLILYHDGDLQFLGETEGCISTSSADAILRKEYDAGFIYNLFHNEKVMSFEQLLQWFSSLDQFPMLHLDLKNFDDCLQGRREKRAEVFAREVFKLIQKYEIPKERLVIGCSDKNILLRLKRLDKDLTLMLYESVDFDKGVKWVLEHKLQGLIIGSGNADKQKIENAHKNKLRIVVFGGRSRNSIIKLIEKNPDAIQVNNVEQMKGLLD